MQDYDKATSQGDSDSLKPLIHWLWVAVTRSEVLDTSPSSVARASPREVALMEPQLLQEQLKVTKADLPTWNNTKRTSLTKRNNVEDMVENWWTSYIREAPLDYLFWRQSRRIKNPAIIGGEQTIFYYN